MKFIVSHDSHSFNLMHVTRVWVANGPDYDAMTKYKLHRRKDFYWDKHIMVTYPNVGNMVKQKLAGDYFTENNEYWYGEIHTHWWYGHYYTNFRWVSADQADNMPLWTVKVELSSGKVLTMTPRTDKSAFCLSANIQDQVNNLPISCRFEK